MFHHNVLRLRGGKGKGTELDPEKTAQQLGQTEIVKCFTDSFDA